MIELPSAPLGRLQELPPARESALGSESSRRPRAAVAKATSLIAMAFVGALALVTAAPTAALAAVQPERGSVYAPAPEAPAPLYDRADEQTIVMAADVAAPVAPADEDYRFEQPAIQSEVAGLGAVSIPQTPSLVWPTGTTNISDGFGYRAAGFHDGVDFVPGNGTPVHAIADGIVTASTDSGGTWGVMITVEHNVDGRVLSSLYAHMQYGSRLVEVGDRVSVGQQLGVVGSTGWSTGPHMHLELWWEDGVRFDGLAWLHERLG